MADKAEAGVDYKKGNKKLGKLIKKNLESFTYTDVASGKSDSISATVANLDMEWMGDNMPPKGAEITMTIVPKYWGSTKAFECGTFIIDDISFSGRPLTCNIGGVSTPTMQDFKSEPRTKTWEKATLKDIASKLGHAAGINVYYEGDSIQIKEYEQNNQTDSAFLYSLCEKYGMAMKVYNKKLVIFDPVKYEAKAAVRKIKEKEMIKWSYNTTIEGTYTGVSLKWTDPDKDSITVTQGEKGRMYSVNIQATSKYDAELQAAAMVNEANRKIETIDFTIPGNYPLSAAQCIRINGLKNADGKYYIDSIKHSVGTGGYTMQIQAHKVQSPIKVNITQKEKEEEKAKQKATEKKQTSGIRRPEKDETVTVNGNTVTTEEYVLSRSAKIAKEVQKNHVRYMD